MHSIFLIFVAMLTMSSSCKENDQINLPGTNEPGKETSGILQPLAGSDELGRVLPLHDEVGDLKKTVTWEFFTFSGREM